MPKAEQSFGLLLRCCAAVPCRRRSEILLYPAPQLIEHAQIILGLRLALPRRQIKPARGFRGVGFYAASLFQHAPVVAHARGVPGLG